MKNINKKILILLLVFIMVIVGVTIGLYLSSKRSNNVLTLEEQEWIDKNKHNVIDIAVINDVPIISYDGAGLIYDYLNFVKEKTKLEFNVIPYKIGNDVDYKVKLAVVSDLGENDTLIYTDKLIYVSADDKVYTKEEEIDNIKIGILKSEKENLSKYFDGKKIEFVEYDDYDKLKSAIKEAKSNVAAGTPPSINGAIILKTLYTKELIENSYKVSYQFENLDRYFVINITDAHEFNSIVSKECNLWSNNLYKKNYNKDLLDIYYKFKKISDLDEKKLKSNTYKYGFINYGVINSLEKRKLKGFNDILLKDFSEFSGLSLSYTKYNSLNKLVDSFNNKNVDFMLNVVDKSKIKEEPYYTAGAYKKQLVFVSGYNNKVFISDISALKGKEVLTIKDSSLDSYLKEHEIKTKLYNDIENLVSDFHSTDIALIDLKNYDFYKSKKLENSRVSYIIDDNSSYNFIVNDIEKNKQFEDLFNFYLMYNSMDSLIYSNYSDVTNKNTNVMSILIIIIIVLSIYIIIDFSRHMNKVFKTINLRRKTKMSKEDKMKYTDQLTSLKNRNYLNSKIEEWDESEVYPQSIIIIDLNNVSYINDNYGREEGDKVIKEAANILIQNQLESSEIIRTDGNEFLIFLVGYNEKQVISYLRKLSKEFKNLSHGFGAASGYSIITDAIKTFDDAVNEAVLDMKNNKEDIDY